MAVALDVKGTKQIGSSAVTSTTYSGINVGAGSNRALIVTLALGSSNTSGWSATWDSGGTNQAMTKLISNVNGSINSAVIFGLRNPTSGTKTLSLSWTGTDYPTVCAISFTGVNQTSDALAFPNATSANATSLTVTSATNNMPVALISVSNLSAAVNQTSLYFDATSPGADSSASYAVGSASVTFSASTASGNPSFVGVDVAAASSGSAFTLTAAEGTYSLSGKVQTLTSSRTISAAEGTYTLTGETQTLGVAITASQGSYTLTGETQTLNSTRSITASEGTYSVTGKPQAFGIGLPAAQGTYSVSGKAQTFAIGMPASEGTYTLTGEAVTLTKSGGQVFTLSVTDGVYSVTGEVQTLNSTRNIYPSEGIYSLQGKQATLEESGGLVFGGKQWRWLKDYEKVAKEHIHHSELVRKAAATISSLGGHARRDSLSPKQRSQIASKAALARWKP